MSLEKFWRDIPSSARPLITLASFHASARPQLTSGLHQLALPSSFIEDLSVLGKHALEVACAELAIDQGVRSPAQLALSTPAIGTRAREMVGAYLVANQLTVFGQSASREVRESSSIVGDLANQVIGALAYTCGLPSLRQLLQLVHPAGAAEPLPSKDPKTTLQEVLQASRKNRPTYTVVSQNGPAHAAEFVVRVSTPDGKDATGTGSRLKQAEAAAAADYLRLHYPNHGLRRTQCEMPSQRSQRPPPPKLTCFESANFLRMICDEFTIAPRDTELVNLAVTHRSFISTEPSGSRYGRDNRLLAALGARALNWAIVDEACRCVLDAFRQNERSDSGLSLIFAALMEPQTVLLVCQNLDLQRNLVLGAGQKANAHPAIMTEALQAFVGALYEVRKPRVKFGSDLLSSREHLLVSPIRQRIRTSIAASRSSLLPTKSLLQERCQAIGLLALTAPHVDGSTEMLVELASVDRTHRLTVSMHLRPTESYRDGQRRFAMSLIDAFDAALGTRDTFSSTALPSEQLALFLLDQALRFIQQGGPRFALERIKRIADLGLLGSNMLGTKHGHDFVRWLYWIRELKPQHPNSALLFLENFYAGLGQFSFAESALAPLVTDVLKQASEFLEHLDPLKCTQDVRGTPAFSAIGDIARIARLVSSAPHHTSIDRMKKDLELLARGAHRQLSVTTPSPDVIVHEIRGSLIAAIHAVIDVARNILGYDGKWLIRVTPESQALLISMEASDHDTSLPRCILPLLAESRLWQCLSDLIPIEDVYTEQQTIRITLRGTAERDLEDFVRRLRWSYRYGAPAKDGSPLVQIGGILHDVKNEVIAFQAAAEAARRSVNTAERYRIAAIASGHAERGQHLIAGAGAVFGSVQRIRRQSVDLGAFFRGYAVEVMSWLPPYVSLIPPTLTSNAVVNLAPVQLRSLLTNLCHNSVEAMPTGGQLGLEWLFDEVNERLEIELWDTGPGIEDHLLKKLNSGEPIRSTKAKGSGVGLLTVLLSIEHLSGCIHFDARQRGGLLVRLAIPADIEAPLIVEEEASTALAAAEVPRVEI